MANYILLERIELNASAASVTFANIPQTGYTDLKVVASVRGDTGSFPSLRLTVNGATTNYSQRRLYGDGSTAASDSASGVVYLVQDPVPSASETASTFSNTEYYIPNYTAAVNKSISVDSVAENNATATFTMMNAGLWSQTTAISSIGLALSSGNLVQYSTFSLYGLAALGTTPAIAPKASGGNIIDYDGTYWIHTFLSSGTFTPQTGLSCEYLVVAGGGAGGGTPGGAGTGAGGGGGAGGLKVGSAFAVTATGYTVTVGAGGAGVLNTSGSKGSDSVFSSITSTGGGFGAAAVTNGTSVSGGAGGSAGGAAGWGYTGTLTGTAASPSGEGNNGGGVVGTGANRAGAGGGGASAAGGQGSLTANTGGNGGNGSSNSITGTSVTYAGGGGGSAGTTNSASWGTGGTGGGAGGKYIDTPTLTNGNAGTVNTGGGGGGITNDGGSSTGGAGGSGIVIIKYLA